MNAYMPMQSGSLKIDLDRVVKRDPATQSATVPKRYNRSAPLLAFKTSDMCFLCSL
jgi:hypothetical protein